MIVLVDKLQRKLLDKLFLALAIIDLLANCTDIQKGEHVIFSNYIDLDISCDSICYRFYCSRTKKDDIHPVGRPAQCMA